MSVVSNSCHVLIVFLSLPFVKFSFLLGSGGWAVVGTDNGGGQVIDWLSTLVVDVALHPPCSLITCWLTSLGVEAVAAHMGVLAGHGGGGEGG